MLRVTVIVVKAHNSKVTGSEGTHPQLLCAQYMDLWQITGVLELRPE